MEEMERLKYRRISTDNIFHANRVEKREKQLAALFGCLKRGQTLLSERFIAKDFERTRDWSSIKTA
jgi:hypothetical protein